MRRLSVVYYGWHSPAIDQLIMSLSPAVLIDNTPAGFWHANCDFAWFQSQGVHVYSYIHGSYSTFDLNTNLAFIDAIANEGTYGVFLDEVNPAPDNYLAAIYNRCLSRGVKLMINPGTPYIDSNIYNYADFVMTDEHYQGRQPNAAESSHLEKTVVIGFNSSWTPEQAAAYSNAAWANGFQYTWHEQVEYINLPDESWLSNYVMRLNSDEPKTEPKDPSTPEQPLPVIETMGISKPGWIVLGLLGLVIVSNIKKKQYRVKRR